MERSVVDKLDVKKNPQEYIDLAYKIELMFFIRALLYQHYVTKGLE